jgi:hypothetical protein
MKKLFAFILLMITAGHTWSQSLSIGSWQTHMAYAQAIDVFETKQHLTVVSNFGVFNLDTKDSSLTVLSKLDGLTEVEIASRLIAVCTVLVSRSVSKTGGSTFSDLLALALIPK